LIHLNNHTFSIQGQSQLLDEAILMEILLALGGKYLTEENAVHQKVCSVDSFPIADVLEEPDEIVVRILSM